jgi:hypothetical protein
MKRIKKASKLAYYAVTYILMLIMALFIITRLCNQPWCPSEENMVYIHKEFYLAIRKNEISFEKNAWNWRSTC